MLRVGCQNWSRTMNEYTNDYYINVCLRHLKRKIEFMREDMEYVSGLIEDIESRIKREESGEFLPLPEITIRAKEVSL